MNATRNAIGQPPRVWERQADYQRDDAKSLAGSASDLWLGRARSWMWLAVGCCLLIKAWLSYTRYFNQDEFESIHQGWLIHAGAVPYRDFNSNHPPLAFEFLSLLNRLTTDPLALMTIGRSTTLVLSLLTLALIFQISQSIYGRLAGYLSVIVYALNATFWEWSIEVRTDSFMVPLWLMAIALLFSARPRALKLRLVLIGLFSGAAFWVNQKAVCHALPIGVLLFCGGPKGDWRIKQVLIALAGSLIPTAYVVIRSCSNSAGEALWLHNFSGAWQLINDSPYLDDRAVTIRMSWLRDTGFWALAILAFVGGWRRGLDRAHRFVLLTCVWMLATLFLTPGPFPYYMLSILPMFAVAIGGWGSTRITELRQPSAGVSRGNVALALLLVGLLLLPPLMRLQHLSRSTIGFQKTVVRLGNQLTEEGSRVFDGAGILINRPDAYPYHWVLWISERERMEAGELPPLIDCLKQNQCRLVIDNFRTRSIPVNTRTQLEQHFVTLWGPLRVPGYDSHQPIGPTPATFELWYDGVYQGNRDDILIDGRLLKQPTFLSAGEHTVSVKGGPGRVTLADVTRAQNLALPAKGNSSNKLWGQYGFRY